MSEWPPHGDAGPETEPDFERALAQLERLASELEEGQLGLDEALARYERGIGLLRRCQELLAAAERRIELLTSVEADGRPRSQPLPESAGDTLEEKSANRSQRRGAAKRGKPPAAGGELFDGPF